MSHPGLSCPKCEAEMELGYSIDHTTSGAYVSHWAAGAPQKAGSLPGWLDERALAEPSVQIPVGTFRCRSCGFLEFYARHEFQVVVPPM